MVSHQEAIKKLNADDQFFSSIGRFISSFSNLEFNLKTYIANEVNLPDDCWVQILSHDFALLCTIAQNVLSREMDEDRTAQLRALIGKCRKLNDHRVRIVHGWWQIGLLPRGKLSHLSRQRLEFTSHYPDADEVAGLADEASKLSSELWQCWSGKTATNKGAQLRKRRT